MKFTFKRKFFLFFSKKVFYLLILIFLFVILILYFKNGIGKFLIATILFIQFCINLFSIISLLVSVNSFLNKLSQKEKIMLEKELSNSIFSFENCFLTDKYAFLLESCSFINYSDINHVSISTSFKIRPNSNILSLIYFKIKIYSADNTYLCLETNSILVKNSFISLLIKKNPNILVQ